MGGLVDALMVEKAKINRDIDDALRIAGGLRIVRPIPGGLCIVTGSSHVDDGTIEDAGGNIRAYWHILDGELRITDSTLTWGQENAAKHHIRALHEKVGKLLNRARWQARADKAA